MAALRRRVEQLRTRNFNHGLFPKHCGARPGVSGGRDQTARAVMFDRMPRFRLSRAICDAGLTSAPSRTQPVRDCVVSQVGDESFGTVLEACSVRNAERISDMRLIQTGSQCASLCLHAVMPG
jgi:hypothetical protein